MMMVVFLLSTVLYLNCNIALCIYIGDDKRDRERKNMKHCVGRKRYFVQISRVLTRMLSVTWERTCTETAKEKAQTVGLKVTVILRHTRSDQ